MCVFPSIETPLIPSPFLFLSLFSPSLSLSLPFSFPHLHTDARSLIQWLLEFRAEDRPNLKQILKHSWLRTTSKDTPTDKTTLQYKRHITSSNFVTPTTTKATMSTSLVPREYQISSTIPRRTDSGTAATSMSHFTPPQDRVGVKSSGHGSPNRACGKTSVTGNHNHGVSSTRRYAVPTMSLNGKYTLNKPLPHASNGKNIHTGSLSSSKTAKSSPFVRRFVSPAPRPASQHYGVQGNKSRGHGQQGLPDASRTSLLVGRKHAF